MAQMLKRTVIGVASKCIIAGTVMSNSKEKSALET